MQLKWTDKALNQFESAIDYIAEEHPANAQQVAERVARAIELLMSSPEMGHEGRISGTREWVVRRTSYIIAYRVESDVLWILRLIPSKQDPASVYDH